MSILFQILLEIAADITTLAFILEFRQAQHDLHPIMWDFFVSL